MICTVASVFVISSCGATSTAVTGSTASEAVVLFSERLDGIDAAVADWRNATSLEAAHAAAEVAANLVVGPNGPDHGDRNDDGVTDGESDVGLLPGIDGTPSGLAIPLSENDCIAADVLGGPWTDPTAEWTTMLAAIEAWQPNNNTMPALPSHPMRVVGWATFTLNSDSLEEAHEYAGHAKLHVDISRRALDC